MREVSVVLTYGNHLEVRVCLEYGIQFLDHGIEDSRIGKAPLAVMTRTAFAVYEGVVFGMCLSVLV